MSVQSSRVYRGHDSYRSDRPRHSHSRSGEEEMNTSTRRRMIKLAVCVGIFLIMFLVKLILPSTIEKISDSCLHFLSGNVDYKAAVSTLGEALSGEKKLSDALSEAYSYAFRISDAGEDTPASDDTTQGGTEDDGGVSDAAAVSPEGSPDESEPDE